MAYLTVRHSVTGQVLPLSDSRSHWLEGLHAPAHIPLGARYLDPAPPANSVMVGAVWTQNQDGTFSKAVTPWGMPGGFSALDLYAMGLLPPEEVPETFLLQDLKDLGNNRYRATKVRVRIQDILAATGPRVPDSTQSQKEFRMGVYVLHEPDREADPAAPARADRIAVAVADFFAAATGGRLKILHSRAEP